MNAYAVCIPEMRTSGCYDEPPEWYMPCGIFVAETANQAKYMALTKWAGQLSSGVYSDDWVNLRARIIEYGPVGWEDGEFFHSLPAGEIRDSSHPYIEYLWAGWPKNYVAKHD